MREILVHCLRDARAIERNVLAMLDEMIRATSDDLIAAELRKHRTQTECHEQFLVERLEALEGDVSPLQRTSTTSWGPFDARAVGCADEAGRSARAVYFAEAVEMAACRLLERLARKAGDHMTAELARRIYRDQERMQSVIEASWERFVGLSRAEDGSGSNGSGNGAPALACRVVDVP